MRSPSARGTPRVDGAQPARVRYACDANPFAAQDEVIVMMLDWNDYQRQLGTTTAEIGRISPDTIRGYRGLADAGAKSGVLDGKTRELIALAVAVTRQCDGCITIHTDAAIKQGATREEIVAALSVAISVNAGAALVFSARVMDAYSAKTATSSASSSS
ncbi:MAG TPA: carboxymuconolactone decarboxylase family protein [Vicinamibacterales bacterium]|nr:carboxymuconolactone decarboxylase family protein [Vicinamibacterales bacterium]